MKRAFFAMGIAALAGAVLFIGCDKDDSPTGTTPPDTDTEVPGDLVLARTFPPLLANGVDEITIYATVVDSAGRGLDGVGVTFTATQGTIVPYATTDGEGLAQSVLTSVASASDLVAGVTASTGSATAAGMGVPLSAAVVVTREPLSDSLRRDLLEERAGRARPLGPAPVAMEAITDQANVPMIGITLVVDAQPGTIPADGLSESRIAARLTETTSGIPLAGESVRFGTTAGSISGEAETGENGQAIAMLVADPDETEAQVSAFYGHTLTAETEVEFSLLTLTLEARETSLLAVEDAMTEIVARLVTSEEGNPVEGAEVRFVTSLGTITSPHATDAQGEATAVFRPGSSTEATATITASFGPYDETVTVTLLPVPQTDQILLSVEPMTLPADGMSEATVRAVALDADGDPVIDGTPVTFSIVSGPETPGALIAPVCPTEEGIATAVYVAGTNAGRVVLQASSGTATATTPLDLEYLAAGAIVLTAGDTSILANGIESTPVTAVVTDLFGNPVLRGTEVTFQTSAGALTAETVPTDDEGEASTWLRSTPFVTGTARVTAKAAGSQTTVDVAFVSEGAYHIEVVGVEPPSIGVRGAGDHETSVVLYEVQDRNGIPVDLTHHVTLDFDLQPLDDDSDASLYPLSRETNELGQAWTTINAGALSGPVEVFASTGSLFAERVVVAIHGGKPDAGHFSIAFQKVNIAGLVYAGLRNGVTAFVGDRHGNPVPLHTQVWFQCEYGLVQGSDDAALRDWGIAGTNEFGEAIVQEVTAGPYPQIPGGDGLVQICAQTVDTTGTRIETCGHVMWSGNTIVEILSPADGFVIENGGSIEILYRVRDANFNPLTEGTAIQVETTAGDLGGDISVLLPDTQSAAYTTFSAVLLDDDAEISEAERVAVTVRVTSFNGNASVSVTGTKN